MSTKTTFKRIALVAVASLGFGVLSVAPSNAAADPALYSLSFAAGATTASSTIAAGDSATVAVSSSFYTSDVFDSLTIKAITTAVPAGGSYSSTRLVLVDSSTASTSANTFRVGTNISDAATTGRSFGNPLASKQVGATFNAVLYAPTVAGTYTIRINSTPTGKAGSGTWSVAQTALTWTVTVTAADTKAAGNSTAFIRPGTSTYASGTALTDSAVVASKTALSTDLTPEATIYVFQRNATNTANESMTVSVDGPAYVSTSLSARPTSATAITAWHEYNRAPATLTTPTGSRIYVWATGTAGKATITVKSINGLLLATKTVYFYGAVTGLANLADPKPLTNVRAGGKSLTSAWAVKATDAAGMPVPNLTLSCLSANTLVIASCAYVDNADGTYTVSLTSAVEVVT